jgi:hypothetical protein
VSARGRAACCAGTVGGFVCLILLVPALLMNDPVIGTRRHHMSVLVQGPPAGSDVEVCMYDKDFQECVQRLHIRAGSLREFDVSLEGVGTAIGCVVSAHGFAPLVGVFDRLPPVLIAKMQEGSVVRFECACSAIGRVKLVWPKVGYQEMLFEAGQCREVTMQLSPGQYQLEFEGANVNRERRCACIVRRCAVNLVRIEVSEDGDPIACVQSK